MKVLAWAMVIALDIPTMMLRGFVLSRLWHWFLVPLGVREIGVALAIGVALLVGMIVHNPNVAQRDEDDEPMPRALVRLFASVIASLFAWGFGAVVAAFV